MACTTSYYLCNMLRFSLNIYVFIPYSQVSTGTSTGHKLLSNWSLRSKRDLTDK